MTYKWDLMLRLLHEAQKSANRSFNPRHYAEEYALELESAGQPMPNLDSLKAEAADYESLLYEGEFMVARTDDEGATGENFILTERGQRLLAMLERRGTERDHFRQRLDEQGEAALQPESFDQLAVECGF